METKDEILNFKISSGLKNIIGKDLIGSKFIALFELIKNSYDANAEKVTIKYIRDPDDNSPSFLIIDDGDGMNHDDLINKWLFVAYSEKNKRNRSYDYIEQFNRSYAGAKGVGRFSCDKLGERLVLYSKKENENVAHSLVINWNIFESNDSNEFTDIPVRYFEVTNLPNNEKKGTILHIENLRDEWNRNDFLTLRKSLEKLISPDLDQSKKPFEIELFVPEEKNNDIQNSDSESSFEQNTVNGIIKNNIIEKLNLQTTNLEVLISPDGNTIQTTLFDRGVFVFKITERNINYRLLHNIKISLLYLNRASKLSFSKQMGISSGQYGSVFIYKNGFRINPYGEPGQDFFGIDRRKAQGYNRYLGTREVMGRIQIFGENEDFTETSSRDQGFLKTDSLYLLEDFFNKKVLNILERYVVNLIKWGEPLKNLNGHTITPEEIPTEIINQFITKDFAKNIISLDFNKNLFTTKATNSDSQNELQKLEELANATDNPSLKDLVSTIKRNTDNLIEENTKLENENRIKSSELEKISSENEIRKQQVFFLENNSNQNVNKLINQLHIMYTLADGNIATLNNCLRFLKKENLYPELVNYLIDIYTVNSKIKKMAELSFKGNTNDQKIIKENIYSFIEQYLQKQQSKKIEIEIKETKNEYICSFNPTSISLILENIISNSEKNFAKKLIIDFSKTEEYIFIYFYDDGTGLNPSIDSKAIFERGFSSNQSRHGFGIGLATIKDLVTEMNGSVFYDEKYTDGFKIGVKFKNEQKL